MRSYELSDEEIVQRGAELYERSIRALMEPEQNGKFVVINVETGDYAIADTTTEAGRIMRTRYPDQVFYEARIGGEFVTAWSAPHALDVAGKH
jgi:hypothetical protein